jgi:hypothetical protein
MELIEVSPSLTLSAITTKLLPKTMDTIIVYISEDVLDLNTIEDDNTLKDKLEAVAMHSRKVEDVLDLNTIEDDNTVKDKLEAVAMHSRKVGKQRHLLLEVLLIFALEDHYMIGLFSQQNYINIVKQCLYNG